jgi:uncharacterized protein
VTEQTDVQVVEAIYVAMAERDVDALIGLVSPEIVITQDERLPWGGRHEGHGGFASFALALTGSITSEVETFAIYAADGEIIQMGRTRGTTVATGTPFDVAEVHRWTLRDGLAVRAHFAIDTPAMLAALGL